MKKSSLLGALILGTFFSISNIVSADVILMNSQTFSYHKQNFEKALTNPASLTANEINSLVYKMAYPDNTITEEEKAYLNHTMAEFAQIAFDKGNAKYSAGEYEQAKKFYQIVIFCKRQADSKILVQTYLNNTDIQLKTGSAAHVNGIREAIKILPDDKRITNFINANLSKWSYKDLAAIGRSYSQKKMYPEALKYYEMAEKIGNDVEKRQIESSIKLTKANMAKSTNPSAPKTTALATTKTVQQVSEDVIKQSEALMSSSYKKFKYNDYQGALNDLNKVHQINPNAAIYNVVYPYYGIMANDYQGAFREINSVIQQGIRPFNSSHKPKAYNLRGALYLLSGESENAISDFSNALKLSFDDYHTAWQGLILAYLMKGDIEKAKAEIDFYNKKTSYYQFADYTTYPGKIMLRLGYDNTITYSEKEKDNLNSYITNQAMKDYFYTLSLFCSWFQD